MTAIAEPITIPRIVHDYIHNVMPHMQGWCSPAKAEALAKVMLEYRPKVCLEIGVFAGRSLIAMALTLHTMNRGGLVVGIDPWTTEAAIEGWENDKPNREWWEKCPHGYIREQCERFIKEMGVDPYVRLVKSTAEQALAGFVVASELHGGGPILDMLHIDGNHSEACALFDVRNYVPLVHANGVVLFDDTNWASTQPAQRELEKHCELLFTVEAEGQACGFYRKR